MKFYVLIAEGFSDAIGFENGKMLHWSKTDFAKDADVIHELLTDGKATKISHEHAPKFIRNLGDLLADATIPFQTFQLELTAEEAHTLNNIKQNKLAYVV